MIFYYRGYSYNEEALHVYTFSEYSAIVLYIALDTAVFIRCGVRRMNTKCVDCTDERYRSLQQPLTSGTTLYQRYCTISNMMIITPPYRRANLFSGICPTDLVDLRSL